MDNSQPDPSTKAAPTQDPSNFKQDMIRNPFTFAQKKDNPNVFHVAFIALLSATDLGKQSAS